MKNDLRLPREAGRLADGVYEILLSRLVSQQIKPGERITFDGVSRELDVSQTPVREALTRLESDGLVEKTHLIGYSATSSLGKQQFESLFDIRLLLETEAAAQAAALASPDQRAQMVASAEHMDALAGRVDPPVYGVFALEDAKLHDLVAASSGNVFIREAMNRLHSQVHLFRLHIAVGVPRGALEEHRVLIDAIAAGDSDAARDAMREHLERSRGRFRVAFDQPDGDRETAAGVSVAGNAV